MELTSSAFLDNGYIPKDYTAEGINMNPPLSFRGVPNEAHSLVITVTDLDAPSGNFVHWIMWNIPPHTSEIGEGVVPLEAVEGKNDFGTFMWGGPNPPTGVHRYEFLLYALDTRIDLPQTSSKDDLLSHIGGLILEKAMLIGLYEREVKV